MAYFWGTGSPPGGPESDATTASHISSSNVTAPPTSSSIQDVVTSQPLTPIAPPTSVELNALSQLLKLRQRQHAKAQTYFDRLSATVSNTTGPEQSAAQLEVTRAAQEMKVASDKLMATSRLYEEEVERLNRGLRDTFESFDLTELVNSFNLSYFFALLVLVFLVFIVVRNSFNFKTFINSLMSTTTNSSMSTTSTRAPLSLLTTVSAPLRDLVANHLVYYPTPANLNYF